LKDKGLEVVGVTQLYGYYKNERPLAPDQEFARLASYIDEWDLTWPLVVGGPANFEAYGVGGIPQYVAIDREGRVRNITVGFSEELHTRFRAAVEKLLADRAARR